MLSSYVSLLLGAGLAHHVYAGPTRIEARAAISYPGPLTVTIDNEDTLPGGALTCGSNTYSIDNVVQAVDWGANLNAADSKRGGASYPHPFGNAENALNLPNYCGTNGKDDNRLEYPLITGGLPYGPGSTKLRKDKSFGAERVVFYLVGVDAEGSLHVNLCGWMTHTGAVGNNFVGCFDVPSDPNLPTPPLPPPVCARGLNSRGTCPNNSTDPNPNPNPIPGPIPGPNPGPNPGPISGPIPIIPPGNLSNNRRSLSHPPKLAILYYD